MYKRQADETDEARYIAEQILTSVAKGRTWSDHAVLYRMNAMSVSYTHLDVYKRQTENNSVAENDLYDDDSGEADDDEDDEPVSFKSFFKKK